MDAVASIGLHLLCRFTLSQLLAPHRLRKETRRRALRSALGVAIALVAAATGFSYQLDRIPTVFDIVSEYVEYNGDLYLSSGKKGAGGWPVKYALQRLDGISMSVLREFNANDVSAPTAFAEYQDVLYFSAQAGSAFHTGLYRTDGAEIELLSSTLFGPLISDLNQPVLFDDAIIYSGQGPAGENLYKWDGTTLGPLSDNPAWQSFAFAATPFEFNDKLIFRGSNPQYGYELYQTDGSDPAVFLDIRPGTANSGPKLGTEWNGHLYFSAVDTGSIDHLLRTDGASIEQVNFADGGRVRVPDVDGMVEYNGSLYFYAANTTSGLELARFDGNSVTIVADISPTSGSSAPKDFVEFEGYLYFTADGPEGRELYQTDGVNVSRFTDINPGEADSNPQGLVEFNGMLVFQALSPDGLKLYAVDDGAVQTFPMEDAATLTLTDNYSQLHVFDGDLYFSASDGTSSDLFRISADSATPGDFNRDGTVDAADYTHWRNSSGQVGIGWSADANSDRRVDAEDYAIWKSFYSSPNSVGGSASLTHQVPEPSALCLFALGFLSLVRPRLRHSR